MPPRCRETARPMVRHAVALIVQVDRRRRRGADHHELTDRESRQRQLHPDVAEDGPERTGRLRRAAGRRDRVSIAGDRERIGPEQDLDHDRGQRVAAEADQKRAGRRRDAEKISDAERRLHQIRPDHRSGARAPHDEPHGPAPLGARAHVGRRVTAQQVRGLRNAEERHPDEQQHEAADRHAGHAEERAENREPVPEHQAGPASRAIHEARQRPAGQRRAERAGGDRHARPRVGAHDAGGHDAADRHADRMPRAAADLRREQGGHQPATARRAARCLRVQGHERPV